MNRLQHQAWPKDVPFDLPKTTTTLYQTFADTAARLPEKNCLIFYGFSLTYKEAFDQVARIANHLHTQCGVKAGDRVAIYAQNSPQYLLAFYAILRAGGVVVPINPMNTTREVRYILENAEAEVIFAAQDCFSHLEPLLASGLLRHSISVCYADFLLEDSQMDIPDNIRQACITPPAGITAWADVLASKPAGFAYDRTPDDIAVLPYTSGSTGKGKGCVHSNATTLHATACMYEWFGFSQSDTFLSVAPMFHVVGLQCGLITPIAIGATTVILPRWNRDVAAQLIREHNVSVWPSVPTMVMDFVNKPNLSPQDVSSLHTVFGGGIAMPETVAKRLYELTKLTFLEGYGLTETFAPATANPRDNPKRQCGGLGVFNTDILIVNPDTLEILPTGDIGEILISGPQVIVEYWRNDAANAESFVTLEGKRFFRSGDLGRSDEQGYIFIVDRLKRMINAAGFKVWPTEVETILYGHPDIIEACVIASSDPYRGETVKALVVLKDGAKCNAEDITKWSYNHMAAYKVPRSVEFVDRLIKSGSGKVLWRELQQLEDAKTRA